MRAVTPAASAGETCPVTGKRIGGPNRRRTFRGRIRHPRRTSPVPVTATGTTGAPVSNASLPTPRRGAASGPLRILVPSGKMTTQSPRARSAFAVAIACSSPRPLSIGNAPSAPSSQACHLRSNSSRFAT
jgi:hypothetical protein